MGSMMAYIFSSQAMMGMNECKTDVQELMASKAAFLSPKFMLTVTSGCNTYIHLIFAHDIGYCNLLYKLCICVSHVILVLLA